MIDPDYLKMYRCPIDPKRVSELTQPEETHLVCSCGVKYPIRDGFPVLLADEAELPPNCPTIAKLPCQGK